MAINKTFPQMSWTTGVAKAKTTNVAKANTKSRDSILTGGLPPGIDTLLSGLILYRGQSLWNEKGARLHVQDDGNLCLWHYPGGKPTTY
ncbi:hypothetical protein BGZ46_009149 [Entomortierella lignicola]|nr:hypothetical protein BGZ46_009149 [Entomortierella lignicola]